MFPEPEMIVVPETISVPHKALSLMSCEVMAGKTIPGGPQQKVTPPHEIAPATTEMAATTTEMAATTTEMAATTTEMAAATTEASTMCERGGRRERQSARQN